MKRILTRFLLRCLFFLLPILIGFEVLFRLGYDPIITNSALFDTKVIRVSRDHIRTVKILSIGSSINLYNLNSAVITANFAQPYYNFASWGLQISDMRLLLADWVRQYHPDTVIICSSLGDFMRPPNDTYRNYTETTPFIRTHFPEYFYFKNYSSIHQIVYRKRNAYPLNFDRWGGAPMNMPRSGIHKDRWDKYFVFPTPASAGAYRALDTLSGWLKDQKVTLVFAQAPINSVYLNAPEAERIFAAHFAKCRAIVTAHDGIYLNYHNPAIFVDSLFFDQPHLQVAGAELMTRMLVADLKKRNK